MLGNFLLFEDTLGYNIQFAIYASWSYHSDKISTRGARKFRLLIL